MNNPIIPTDTDFANSIPNSRAFILSGIPVEPSTVTRDECRIVQTTKTRAIIRHTIKDNEGIKVFYEKAVLNPQKSGDCILWKALSYTGFVFKNPA